MTATRLLILIYGALANAAALQNITITVPEGTSNHGDPTLLCTPVLWSDVLSFYLGNYIAHAATVITSPGESAVSVTINVVISLLFPTSGVIRGISAIMSFAKFAKTNLQMAARAQALCMVARKKGWKPIPGDSPSGVIIRAGDGPSKVNQDLAETDCQLRLFDSPWGSVVPVQKSTRIVHGSYTLPPGYQLVYVPQDAEFTTDSKFGAFSSQTHHRDPHELSCSYSVVKILVSLGQSLYAAITLFRSRGDQIMQYGYAAFGLTVAQYAVMSIVNLLGNLMVPEYPALYLVESSVMAEARRHEGGYFDGVIGRLAEDPDAEFTTDAEREQWLAQPLKFESLLRENRLVVEVEPMAQPTDQQQSMKTETSSKTASGDGIEMPDRTRNLAVSVSSTVDPPAVLSQVKSWPRRNSPPPESKHDGRPILFVPTCPVLKRRVKSKQIKPRYTICGQSDPSMPLIQHNLAHGSTSEWPSYVVGVLITAIPIAIIGSLTGFQPASSTLAQRVWTMTWLCFGVFFGVWMRFIHSVIERSLQMSGWNKVWFIVSWIVIFAAPAVGGFVVVGQMLIAFGTCLRIAV